MGNSCSAGYVNGIASVALGSVQCMVGFREQLFQGVILPESLGHPETSGYID
ncbi:hypothetical protein D3C80_2109780 [compost metagenome]